MSGSQSKPNTERLARQRQDFAKVRDRAGEAVVAAEEELAALEDREARRDARREVRR